jgi:hypothetical protein
MEKPKMEKDSPWLWQFTPLLKSSTMRALLIGAVSWLLSSLGVSESVAGEDASRWVELALQLIEGGAFAWAAWSRYHQPTPPLALTAASAAEKNSAVLAATQERGDS